MIHANRSGHRIVGPVRTCVGCRSRASVDALLRVVAGSGAAGPVAVPDPRRRHSGRGAWLHPDPDCLQRAERRKAFSRALRVRGAVDASAVREHLSTRLGRATHRVTDVGRSPCQATDRKQVDPS
ncbi:YlxR family protein [Bounagaea algeriensis]